MDVNKLFDEAHARVTPFALLKCSLYGAFDNLYEQGYPEEAMLTFVMDMQGKMGIMSPMLTQTVYATWVARKQEASEIIQIYDKGGIDNGAFC